jgi:6-phosphogluconate dehydrogenase
MKVGVIGLGKMGSAIAQRLVDTGYDVVGFDNNPAAVDGAREQGITVVHEVSDVAKAARVIWLSLPAGEVVDEVIKKLLSQVKKADVIIDAGNSHFTDSQRRAQCLATHDVAFLDCGLSGGVQGCGIGFCLMIGGDKASYTKIEAILAAVAAPGGVAHVGSAGAGHYIKMVHNAIEYGLLQAYAEGLQLLHEGTFAKELDLAEITELWNHGSLVRSWLLDLTNRVVARDEELRDIMGLVEYGSTVQWALEDAKEHAIKLPIIHEALRIRQESSKNEKNYANKLVAVLRHEFGGHRVKRVNGEHDESN